MKTGRRRQNSIHGALILLASTVIVKVIGAVFKIPLGRLIGGTGMGYYMSAYELYAPIYTIAMAGLPIAVSKLVAAAVSEGRYRDARCYLSVSKKAFYITGFTGFLAICLLAYPFAAYISKDYGVIFCITAVAPSMLFCCVAACYRGYYEGFTNMYPTAVSQIIEALSKLFFGYGIAYFIIKIGLYEFNMSSTVFGEHAADTSAAYAILLPLAAAGAIGGVTLGTFGSAVYMTLKYHISGDGITRAEILKSPPSAGQRENMRVLTAFAVPVVLGALAQNISGLIDLLTVQRQLAYAVNLSAERVIESHSSVIAAISPDKIPTFLFGCYKGFAYSFYNLVPTVTSVIGVSVLPNLAAAWVKRDSDGVRKNIESVLRMTAILAVPVGFGISCMAGPILTMLYPSQPTESAVSAELLKWLGFAGVAAGITMPLTSMLQAIDKQVAAVRNLFIGIAVKLIMNVVLVRIPEINIMGAAYSTLACYVIVMLLDLISLIRFSKVRVNVWRTLIKPIISGVMCSVAAASSFGFSAAYFGVNGRLDNCLFSGLSVLAGGAVYILSLCLLRAITREDLKMLPFREKNCKNT